MDNLLILFFFFTLIHIRDKGSNFFWNINKKQPLFVKNIHIETVWVKRKYSADFSIGSRKIFRWNEKKFSQVRKNFFATAKILR